MIKDIVLRRVKEKEMLRRESQEEEWHFKSCIFNKVCPYCGEDIVYKKIPKGFDYFIGVFLSLFWTADIPHEYQLVCETHGVVYSDFHSHPVGAII